MNENERIKLIRQELDLTLEAFGNKIGLTRSAVYQMENRVGGVTEQVKKAICREFNVSYMWLLEGVGDMFKDEEAALIAMIDHIMDGEDQVHKDLIKSIAKMDASSIRMVKNLIDILCHKE